MRKPNRQSFSCRIERERQIPNILFRTDAPRTDSGDFRLLGMKPLDQIPHGGAACGKSCGKKQVARLVQNVPIFIDIGKAAYVFDMLRREADFLRAFADYGVLRRLVGIAESARQRQKSPARLFGARLEQDISFSVGDYGADRRRDIVIQLKAAAAAPPLPPVKIADFRAAAGRAEFKIIAEAQFKPPG